MIGTMRFPDDIHTLHEMVLAGRAPQRLLDSKIAAYVADASSRPESTEHAAEFLNALLGTRGAPQGKLWTKDGAVRVYVSDVGYIAFSACGGFDAERPRDRDKVTLLPSNLWPSQRKAYRQAAEKYFTELPERLREHTEARVDRIDEIHRMLDMSVRQNPGFDISDFIDDVQDSSMSTSTIPTMKRGDIVSVGRTKWVVMRTLGSFQALAYKHPSKHRKLYEILALSRTGFDVVVFEVGGSGQRISDDIVSGPLRVTGDTLDLGDGGSSIHSTKTRVLR